MQLGSRSSGTSAIRDHVAPPSLLTAVLRTRAPANCREFRRTLPSFSSTICTSLIWLRSPIFASDTNAPGAFSPQCHVAPLSSLIAA